MFSEVVGKINRSNGGRVFSKVMWNATGGIFEGIDEETVQSLLYESGLNTEDIDYVADGTRIRFVERSSNIWG
jgi:hypothetical protein